MGGRRQGGPSGVRSAWSCIERERLVRRLASGRDTTLSSVSCRWTICLAIAIITRTRPSLMTYTRSAGLSTICVRGRDLRAWKAVAHAQLPRDLLHLSICHAIEEVEAAEEPELVRHVLRLILPSRRHRDADHRSGSCPPLGSKNHLIWRSLT